MNDVDSGGYVEARHWAQTTTIVYTLPMFRWHNDQKFALGKSEELISGNRHGRITVTMDHTPHIPRIVQIAARVEQDIRGRKLKPGDSYLNTEEVARMLGVSKATANRAMQLLAKRHVLRRGQRKGVTIAEGIASMNRSAHGRKPSHVRRGFRIRRPQGTSHAVWDPCCLKARRPVRIVEG